MDNHNRALQHRGTYISQFLHLKCAGDVLNALGHPVKSPEREIVRAMACLRVLRADLRAPREVAVNGERATFAPVRLIELAGESCTLSVLAAHVLPYKEVVAIGEQPPRWANLDLVQRLAFRRGDVYAPWVERHLESLDSPLVLASTHATPRQAERVVRLYRLVRNVTQLVLLMAGDTVDWGAIHSKMLAKEIGAVTAWAVEHAGEIGADVFRDQDIPKQFGPRVLVHARRRRAAGLTLTTSTSTRTVASGYEGLLSAREGEPG